MARHERDYIDRTIATVRNHRDADNCWPQWANIFADEIEDLRERLEHAEAALKDAIDVAVWMSGSEDFSIEGCAGVAWANEQRPKLFAAMDVLEHYKRTANADQDSREES